MKPRSAPQYQCQCKKRKSLIVLFSDDPTSLSQHVGIVKYVQSTDGDFDVLDVRRFDFLGFSLRKSGGKAPRKDVLWDRLQLTSSNRILTPESIRRPRDRPTPSWLNQSSESALFSHLKTPNPRKSAFLYRKIKRRLEVDALSIHDFCLNQFSKKHYCEVYVRNGRLPLQVAVVEAAKKFNYSVVFWELGMRANNMYIGNNTPQDWRSIKDFHESFTPSSAQLLTAKDWLTRRTHVVAGSDRFSTNLFSKRFDASKSSLGEGGPRQSSQLSFFTSSQDEYWALGDLWPKSDWGNQYSAFNQIMDAAGETRALRPVVRMHPNTIEKSPKYVLSEVRSVSRLKALHPDLRIVWPHQSENSYDLACASQWVVVWNSTMGMEAMFLGCNVRHLAESSFPLASKSNLLTPQGLHAFWGLEGSFGQNRTSNQAIAVQSVAAKLARNLISIEAIEVPFMRYGLKSLLMANSFLCITLHLNRYLWRQFAKVTFRIAGRLVR